MWYLQRSTCRPIVNATWGFGAESENHFCHGSSRIFTDYVPQLTTNPSFTHKAHSAGILSAIALVSTGIYLVAAIATIIVHHES